MRSADECNWYGGIYASGPPAACALPVAQCSEQGGRIQPASPTAQCVGLSSYPLDRGY